MVVVRFKQTTPSKQIDGFMDQLRQYWSRVPGITYHAAGPYSSPEGLNQGYTHGFLVTFSSPTARDKYLVDPEHERLVSLIMPTLDGVLAFDFEVPEGNRE
jgi:hypothetical protein